MEVWLKQNRAKCFVSFYPKTFFFLFSAANNAGGRVATKAGAYGGSEVGSIIGNNFFHSDLYQKFTLFAFDFKT